MSVPEDGLRAVVLAAGRGTRMGPLTETRPKPLLPVAGRPLLERVLDACVPHVEAFVVVTGYRGEAVRDAVGDAHAGRPVTYVTQPDQRGTADALARARDHVAGDFLVLNGDVCLPPGLVGALAASPDPAMAVKPVADPRQYGVVSVADGRVADVVEKPDDPPSKLANLGAYRLPESIFEHVAATPESARGERELTDSIARYLTDGGHLVPVEHEGAWVDVGRPWDLLAATDAVLADAERSLDGDVADGATIEGTVVVEAGATVEPGAHLRGPVVVKRDATVGPNAFVRDGTVLGEGVRVGHAVEVKHSVLMRETNVAHLSYVGDSVLGEGVNFGAGTVVANLRHDGAPVRVRVGGEAVDTGRRKFGVVVGDGVKTGIDTSIDAGVTLGPGVRTAPGETVVRDRE